GDNIHDDPTGQMIGQAPPNTCLFSDSSRGFGGHGELPRFSVVAQRCGEWYRCSDHARPGQPSSTPPAWGMSSTHVLPGVKVTGSPESSRKSVGSAAASRDQVPSMARPSRYRVNSPEPSVVVR